MDPNYRSSPRSRTKKLTAASFFGFFSLIRVYNPIDVGLRSQESSLGALVASG
jgi:hypothetical protein